jgi:succinoglycan biosynthesis transport protein ExoP
LISSRPPLPLPAPEQVYAIPMPPGDEESSHVGMSLAQVISIVRAYRWHIMISAASLVLLSAIIIKLLPKVYIATATLIVNYENKDPLAGRDFPVGEVNTYIPTQIELITSRVVMNPVIQQLKLTTDPQFTNGFVGPPAALNEVVVKNLQASLQVVQGVGSQLLYVSATAKEPYHAAAIANAIAEEYLKQERQRTNEPAGERAERYSKQLAELRAKSITAQDRLTEFRQQNGMTEVDVDRTDVEGAALADLETKFQAAQNARRELEAHQIDARASSEAVLNAVPVVSLRSRLESQEAEMAQLRATLGPKHPKVIELQSQIDATRRSLADEVQAISANNSVQLAQARDLETKYKNAIEAERTRLLGRRALEDQSAKLVLELQSAQATYKKALDGYDQIVFASAGNYHDVSLVSRADPPVKSDKPNKVKLFLLALVLSVGVGVGWPFAYELLANRRLRCQDDFERHFGIPVLAQFGPAVRMSG